MKYRTDFVTNSSSSSSVVILLKNKTSIIGQLSYEVENITKGINEYKQSYKRIIEILIASKQLELYSKNLRDFKDYFLISGYNDIVINQNNKLSKYQDNDNDFNLMKNLINMRSSINVISFNDFVSHPIWSILEVNPSNLTSIEEKVTYSDDNGDSKSKHKITLSDLINKDEIEIKINQTRSDEVINKDEKLILSNNEEVKRFDVYFRGEVGHPENFGEKWSIKDIEFIKRNYPYLDIDEIAFILKRDILSVLSKIENLGVEEQSILEQKKNDFQLCYKDFNSVNKVNIEEKNRIIKPKYKLNEKLYDVFFEGTYKNPINYGKKWTEVDIIFLRNNFGVMEIDELAFILKRDILGVIIRLEILGLIGESEVIQIKSEYENYYSNYVPNIESKSNIVDINDYEDYEIQYKIDFKEDTFFSKVCSQDGYLPFYEISIEIEDALKKLNLTIEKDYIVDIQKNIVISGQFCINKINNTIIIKDAIYHIENQNLRINDKKEILFLNNIDLSTIIDKIDSFNNVLNLKILFINTKFIKNCNNYYEFVENNLIFKQSFLDKEFIRKIRTFKIIDSTNDDENVDNLDGNLSLFLIDDENSLFISGKTKNMLYGLSSSKISKRIDKPKMINLYDDILEDGGIYDIHEWSGFRFIETMNHITYIFSKDSINKLHGFDVISEYSSQFGSEPTFIYGNLKGIVSINNKPFYAIFYDNSLYYCNFEAELVSSAIYSRKVASNILKTSANKSVMYFLSDNKELYYTQTEVDNNKLVAKYKKPKLLTSKIMDIEAIKEELYFIDENMNLNMVIDNNLSEVYQIAKNIDKLFKIFDQIYYINKEGKIEKIVVNVVEDKFTKLTNDDNRIIANKKEIVESLDKEISKDDEFTNKNTVKKEKLPIKSKDNREIIIINDIQNEFDLSLVDIPNALTPTISGYDLEYLREARAKYKPKLQFSKKILEDANGNKHEYFYGDTILSKIISGFDVKAERGWSQAITYCKDEGAYKLMKFFGAKLDTKNLKHINPFDLKPFILEDYWDIFKEMIMKPQGRRSTIYKIIDIEVLEYLCFKGVRINEIDFSGKSYDRFALYSFDIIFLYITNYYNLKDIDYIKALDILINKMNYDYKREVEVFDNKKINKILLPEWFTYVTRLFDDREYFYHYYDYQSFERGYFENFFSLFEDIDIFDTNSSGQNIFYALLSLNAKCLLFGVKELLKMGLSPNVKDKNGVSFLDYLKMSNQNYEKVIELIEDKK